MKKTRFAASAVTGLAALSFAAAPAFAAPGGNNSNNGTLKVHEQGTPAGFEDNDPKVCTFNFEGYVLDEGQTAEVRVFDKATDAVAKTVDLADLNKDGYAETAYISGLPVGHYYAIAFNKANNEPDLKAKSKVFKVGCEPTAPVTDPVTTPEPTDTPTTTPTTTAPEPTETPKTPAPSETPDPSETPKTPAPTDTPKTPAPSDTPTTVPTDKPATEPSNPAGPKVETDSVQSDNTAGIVAGAGLAVAALGGGLVLRRRTQA